MRRSYYIGLVALLCTTLFVTACAGDPNRRTKIGAGVGAAVGAASGALFSGDRGKNAAIGAAVGALAGAGVGNYMDNQAQQLKKKLAAQRARNELAITRLNGDALKIGVASDASFAVDSATLNGNAQNTFNTIANVLKDYDKTAIHVVGFTDSTGSAQYNMQLSEQRARSVAQFLTGRGVNSQRVLTWGRGQTQPVASNDTQAGRAQNRRVDIVLKPIVKGRKRQAFSEPPNLGS